MLPTRQVAAWAVLVWSWAGIQPAPAAGAQGGGLAAVRSLDCTFTLMSVGTWTDGAPEAQLDDSELPSGSRRSTRRRRRPM